MRMFDITESTSDIPASISDVISRYSTNTPRSLFIRFKDPEQTEYIIPLKSFIRRTMVYQTLWDVNTAEIIRVKGNILHLTNLTREAYVHYASKLGITDIEYTYEYLSSKLPITGMTSPYGKVLFYILSRRVQQGKVFNSKINKHELNSRLRSLKISAVIDTSNVSNEAIINHRFPASGIVSDERYVSIVETINIERESIESTIDQRVEEIAARVASEVLSGGLNTDEPFIEGPDAYYWTYDGMQIRITRTSGISNIDQGLLFDIETPYGILYHLSTEEESDDDIINELSLRYSRMTQPLVNWRPRDRDIFLHNMQMDFRDNDVRIVDLVREVRKYYPVMREYGRRFKIFIPPLSAFSPINKSYLSGIIDVFANEPNAREFMKRITNDGEITDISILSSYFPRQRLPTIIDSNDLEKMAMIYDIAKKNHPDMNGWRVFRDMK